METESTLTRFFDALEREWRDWLFGYCVWLSILPTALGWLLFHGLDVGGMIKASIFVYLLAAAFSLPVMILGDIWKNPLQANIAMTYIATAGIVGFIATVYSFLAKSFFPAEHAVFVAICAIIGGLLISFLLASYYEYDNRRNRA